MVRELNVEYLAANDGALKGISVSASENLREPNAEDGGVQPVRESNAEVASYSR